MILPCLLTSRFLLVRLCITPSTPDFCLNSFFQLREKKIMKKAIILKELLCVPRGILRRDICEGDVGLAVVLDQGRGSLLLVQDLHVYLNNWGAADWLENDRERK